ncbi:MAG: Pyoverdin chromophore biosynthetic protein pvcC [Woeseiaceae bacterium]|nr:Pyoverdin chromophore biosynthetic protein pvcC [Woeseiaceae bacterium]
MSSSAPENTLKGKNRPFNGKEYIESLQDEREIYIYGERVKDVTKHPAFRNSVQSIARLYDALHSSDSKEILTCDTDTGSGGYTHRFFRYATNSDDLFAQRSAMAEWAKMSYGWMGRTPDYKASFTNTLGANPDFYGQFSENAKSWYKKTQEAVPFINHALVNPPIDRDKIADDVKDVYISIDKETDSGIYVSGAKVVATSSALTHYNFLGQNMAAEINDDSMAIMFIADMRSPGIKLICRPSYELQAAATGSPFDYPLSSRFDENDAIFIFDNAFIPWENVFVHRDIEMLKAFYPKSGFVNGYTFQSATRMSVKLDFIIGILSKALKATGTENFRGVQVQLGEVIGWRNLIWSLTDAMAGAPDPWVGGAVLPSMKAATAYRIFSTEAYPQIKAIIEKIVASGLIYLPSSNKDFKNSEIDKYLEKYVRGSNGMGHKERIKIMKLLWDAIGTEFGGRHELYERNYAGNHELIRISALMNAKGNGSLSEMEALAEACMSDYNEEGWTDNRYHNGEDISVLKNLNNK